MTLEELQKTKIRDLYTYCGQIGVKHYTSHNKEKLIEVILAKQLENEQNGKPAQAIAVPQSAESKRKPGRPKKVVEEKQEEVKPRRGRPKKQVEAEVAPPQEVTPEPAKPEHAPVQPEPVLVQPEPTPEQSQPVAAVSPTPTTEAAPQAPAQPEQFDQRRNNYDNRFPLKRTSTGSEVEGVLELCEEGYGFLRCENYGFSAGDIFMPPAMIKRFRLKNGDYIKGLARREKEGERYNALYFVSTINDDKPDAVFSRKPFDTLTPIYPNERIHLEHADSPYSMRLVDLFAPIGKGQRGLIVSPPKAGKTTILKEMARSIRINHPDVKLITLLIGERPEEVTDMQRGIDCEVAFSTFDQEPTHHVHIAEMVFERAQRLVEHNRDVVILLDSITRLARAYNLVVATSGKTLSGGLDATALFKPKKFFGRARNVENGGSLTVIATALIETGSRMDDVIFEDLKGTGNMEIHLDRRLQERRIFPAIDIYRSGTRHEELLLSKQELDVVYAIRKAFGTQPAADVTETIINRLINSKTNEQLVGNIMTLFNKML